MGITGVKQPYSIWGEMAFHPIYNWIPGISSCTFVGKSLGFFGAMKRATCSSMPWMSVDHDLKRKPTRKIPTLGRRPLKFDK